MKTLGTLLLMGFAAFAGFLGGLYASRPTVPYQAVALLLQAASADGVGVGERARLHLPENGEMCWAREGDKLEFTFPESGRPSVEVRLPVLGVKRRYVEEVEVGPSQIKIEVEDFADLTLPVR